MPDTAEDSVPQSAELYTFDEPDNNMLAAVSRYASWGLFDAGEGSGGGGARSNYRDGYQLVPVNWSTCTPTKQGFFRLLREVTGGRTVD